MVEFADAGLHGHWLGAWLGECRVTLRGTWGLGMMKANVVQMEAQISASDTPFALKLTLARIFCCCKSKGIKDC